MRTLGTQVRLRRLIRQHGELLERLSAPEADGSLRLAAVTRLGALVDDIRDAWAADVAAARPSPELRVCDAHVRRTLRSLDAATAELRRAPAGVEWLRGQFLGTAVPLLLFLRGLEETPETLLEGWLAPSLARSA